VYAQRLGTYDEVQEGGLGLAEWRQGADWRLSETLKAVANVDAQVRDRAAKT
jgi:hypothetical protein